MLVQTPTIIPAAAWVVGACIDFSVTLPMPFPPSFEVWEGVTGFEFDEELNSNWRFLAIHQDEF